MKLRRAGPAPGAMIALTPLIDIVFILLIFFMLASRFDLWGGFTLALGAAGDLPAQTGDAVEEPERSVVLVRLAAGDLVRVGGRIWAMADLAILVAQEKNNTTDHAVTFAVRAEPDSSVQALVALLEGLKAAGAAEISLVPVAPGP